MVGKSTLKLVHQNYSKAFFTAVYYVRRLLNNYGEETAQFRKCGL